MLIAGVVACMWCLATLVFVVVRSASDGSHFTGAYAGLFPGDQLRYLAWIRGAGLHLLIADPSRRGAPHIYLQPVFVISGLLWRAGLSLQLSYLIWTPVALGVLLWGYASFVAHFVRGRARAAALALALCCFSPLVPLFDYAGIVNRNGANALVIAASQGATYWQAWGFLPTVIAVGLMPVSVLGLQRPAASRAATIQTSLAGLLVAWLSPWSGLELVLIATGMLLLRRGDHAVKRNVVAGLASAAPLLYYLVLTWVDPSWSLGNLRSGAGGPAWPLLVAYLPLVLVAAPALRECTREDRRVVLPLWFLAVLITYLVLPGSRDLALQGASLPLSILVVRSWQRLRLQQFWAWAAVALAIVPGAFYSAHTFHDVFSSHDYPFSLNADEQHAVSLVRGERGGVLASPYMAVALPALAGLLDGQVRTTSNQFFSGTLSLSDAERVVRADDPHVVVSDCGHAREGLWPELQRLAFVPVSSGCAQVYRRRVSSAASSRVASLASAPARHAFAQSAHRGPRA